MSQVNYQTQINASRTETQVVVVEEKSVDVTLSDSSLLCLEEAQQIANQIGDGTVKTEHIVLAILSHKSPTNLTTTAGRMLRDNYRVTATDFASYVCSAAGKSMYSLDRKFGGYR
jgi:ATP-dependent Clp protease ATP-binding subunit ClpA